MNAHPIDLAGAYERIQWLEREIAHSRAGPRVVEVPGDDGPIIIGVLAGVILMAGKAFLLMCALR